LPADRPGNRRHHFAAFGGRKARIACRQRPLPPPHATPSNAIGSHRGAIHGRSFLIMRKCLVAAVLVLAAIAATPARAALFCDIPKNPDGFVALRDKPSGKGHVVAQMKDGDEVQLLEGSRGKWVEVLHWHGQDRKKPARAGDTRRGWVQARLIGACG
jgi:hypothetical protein